jgi:hypothetical protein
VFATQNNKVWGAKVALLGVSEKGLDVYYCVERDPPFIFEGEIGCEEQLEGTDALDGQGSGSGIGDAQTKWAQARLVEVRDRAVIVEPHIVLVIRRGIVPAVLVRVVRAGDELGEIVLEIGRVVVVWVVRHVVVRNSGLLRENGVGSGVAVVAKVGGSQFVVQKADLGR